MNCPNPREFRHEFVLKILSLLIGRKLELNPTDSRYSYAILIDVFVTYVEAGGQ
jgi:hypothetical protein